MDLDKAIGAHADWKIKLRRALDEHETLDAERLSADCHCELGQWLHGPGRVALGSNPTFLSCVEAHRDFHAAAGAVARKINAKDYAAATAQLDIGSAFANASTAVAVAVRRLKRDTAPA